MGGLPSTGEVLCSGRYKLKRLLGAGDRKRVYTAHDERMDRDVALSLVEVEGRFNRELTRTEWEVRVTARLGDHPHIVTVYDSGLENGRAYIVTQLLRGGTLGELCERCCEDGDGLELDDLLRLGRQVTLGLAHVHNAGFLHRDLQPRNVWLDSNGKPHIGDFDDAMPLDQPQATGEVITTAPYCPPEQIEGRWLDVRSDLYSLGATLYELATGRPPFEGDNDAVLARHLNEVPKPPSHFRPGLPKALDELVLALLAKQPWDRPDDAEAVAQALEGIAEDRHALTEPADLSVLLSQGENERLEFKSSLRYAHDLPADAPPEARKAKVKVLEMAVATVIGSFLNAKGGTLLIGVADDAHVVGIEWDFETLGSKGSLDGWELAFKEAMTNRLGSSARTCTSLRFVETADGTVAIVRCSARTRPTWLNPTTDQEEFWVRVGNANQRLFPSEAHRYIDDHWGA